MTILRELWHVYKGKEIFLYTLSNENIRVKVSTLGCIIQSLAIQMKGGSFRNIVLGYDTAEEYLSDRYYTGCILGRYAGRIGGASYTIDNQIYNLSTNEHLAGNQLHGGFEGFNKKIFSIRREKNNDNGCLIQFHHESPHLDEGHPGTLNVLVTIALDQSNELRIVYEAQTSLPTHVNLSHHHYFNLSGKNSIADEHELTIHADSYLRSGSDFLPDGKIFPVHQANDFSIARELSEEYFNSCINEYYLLNKPKYDNAAATLKDKRSGLAMEINTTYPCVVLYNGYYLGPPFHRSQGICLETQMFPDSPHHSLLPATLLKPGDKYIYETKMTFRQ